jgi:dTDP-4-dehydrorhamnose reductase
MQGEKNQVPGNLPKTAIIGAGGFLGSAFLTAYRQVYADCIGTVKGPASGPGILQLDLLNPDIAPLNLNETKHKQALILAAISKIADCEKNPDLSRKVNVAGTLELIRQFVDKGIKPIFFSSDYVFDGAQGNYADEAKTNPITEYGRQKAEVENQIKKISKNNYLVVRLSKVFSLTKNDQTLLDEMGGILANGGVLYSAYDQIFSPIFISDVVYAVMHLQAKEITGIVNVCSPEVWTRYDLALKLQQELGFNKGRVIRLSLDELGFENKRPKNTSMVPKRLLSETSMSFTPIEECIRGVAKNWVN